MARCRLSPIADREIGDGGAQALAKALESNCTLEVIVLKCAFVPLQRL
jgi:hypothetical protein